MTTRVPLILDVDTGIDDSLALLYAAASPEADLVGVTCLSGNVEARQVAVNTLAILELAGRTDVEVALGRRSRSSGPSRRRRKRMARRVLATPNCRPQPPAQRPPRRRPHRRRGAPTSR
ncbi:MAG: nucleoside hydrolase [Candidatus Limnocylindrales bacterium]